MPSALNPRTFFAAAAAFVVALAVAYALSSAGQASPGSGDPGSPADPLDVAAGIEGQATLGDADALPGLVHKPKPKPAPKEEEPADEPATPVTSTPTPTVVTPQQPTTAPPPTQTEPPPEVFSDSG
jgi:outer membrane biosynthesis protein TonB